VGADITCGILATGLCAPGAARLLVDVGTNGEMALHTGGRLLCCATAAGPAFEGANISMGMPATPGAVYKVERTESGLVCRTVGGARPIGICGTGLISALGVMLRTGAMDETGRLASETFALADQIVITQQDVRNLQLAKAAIAAGIEALLGEAGLSLDEVGALYLAGGFGSYIDPAEAAAIGLIPRELAAKAVTAGNAALTGAVRMLFDDGQRMEGESLAAGALEIPLATNPRFMDAYIEHMGFWDE